MKKSQIIKAEKFTQKIIAFKKRLKTIKVTPQILDKEKSELSKLFKVKIQYFELVIKNKLQHLRMRQNLLHL